MCRAFAVPLLPNHGKLSQKRRPGFRASPRSRSREGLEPKFDLGHYEPGACAPGHLHGPQRVCLLSRHTERSARGRASGLTTNKTLGKKNPDGKAATFCIRV